MIIEPVILSVDLGMTTGLAIGQRKRTHHKNKWRLDMYWDGVAKEPELYGYFEQIRAEYPIDVVIAELPVISMSSPIYHNILQLVKNFNLYTTELFADLPVIEVKPAQWKTTPAKQYRPPDDCWRTVHQWDACRMLYWFIQWGIENGQ